MSVRNCVVPITIRLRGIPGADRLAEASDAIARIVAARLAEANRLIGVREGWTAWDKHYQRPHIRFADPLLDQELQRQVTAAVEDGIGRAVSGGPAALRGGAASLFQLAKFPSGSAGSAGIRTTDDTLVLTQILRLLDTLPNGEERRGAIEFLVGLAIKDGPAREAATARLIQLLSGNPNKSFDDHQAAISALKEWVATEIRAYDLLLYGRLWYADHSKLAELGSGLALDAFRRYLHYAGGKWAIEFLRSRINGSDRLKANLAARIVSDLLEGENDDSEQKYKANYAALRAMARANGWEAYGPLGAASATPRIFSALEALRQQADELRHLINIGPVGDPWDDKDVERLTGFIAGLSVKGLPRAPATLDFTAENREETEHALLFGDSARTSDWLNDLALTLTIAVDAGARLQEVTQTLHANVGVLDQFLGTTDAARSADERVALFDLRHNYIEAWVSLPGLYTTSTHGLAAVYQRQIDAVQHQFDNFDEVVSQRKYRTARDHFQEYAKTWNDGDQQYIGNDKLDEKFFFTMRRILAFEREYLANNFNRGFGGPGLPSRQGSADYADTNLASTSRLSLRTSLFGLRAALYLIYATNLTIHNVLLKAVEDERFKARKAAILVAMRSELEDTWNSSDYDTFLKRTDGYKNTLQEVVSDIKHEVKVEFLINLVITIIAALVTEGAALAVRLAALSETLAIARTARAISSVSTFVDIGVFTATELSLQKGLAGKDVGAIDVVKTAATNLLFLGAMKGIGRFTDLLPKGGPVQQLLLGHLVGFSGIAAVSATMTKLETGQWPPDIAEFLTQTAITYLALAGLKLTFDGLVARPALKNLVDARMEALTTANEALLRTYTERVNAGTLTPTEFEAMRNERIRLVEEARAIAKVLHDANVIQAADMAGINQMMDAMVAVANGAKFPLARPGAPATGPLALPAPDSVPGIIRVGDTDVYVYDPAKPRAPVDELLGRYRERGFAIAGNNTLMRVLDPAGRTRFLLSASPIATPRLALPAASGRPQPEGSPLARATGLPEPQLSAASSALAMVNRDAETKLPAEYPDHTVLATLSLLVEQLSVIRPNWKIDAVRGVADSLALERGIPRSAVRRLFQTIDPAALPAVFEAFHDIVNSPKVAAGSNYLIADDLQPRNSARLIDAYRTLERRRIELPDDMDNRAVRGLLRQLDKLPGGWVDWLVNIAKADRANALRDASGLPDLRPKVPGSTTEMLAKIKQDIPGQRGLNPLAGADGEAFVKALEARAGAKFADPRAREAYVSSIDRLRSDAARLEQGDLPPDKWEDLVDRTNDVRKTALQQLALSLPPRPPALLTARGDLTPAGVQFVRSRYANQDVGGGMNPRRVSDLKDDEINQQFSHEWKWLEDIVREEVRAEWNETQREAAQKGTPLDPTTDFTLLEGRTFNTIWTQLQEAGRASGRSTDPAVLTQQTGAFLDGLLAANDASVRPAYDLCERTAQEARDRRATAPPGRGRRPEDFADRWAEALRDFRRGTIGAKKPDILEVMLSQNQIVVTDPSLAYADPIHNFKLAVYRAVIERLLPGVQVGAMDIRAVLRHTLAGP